MHEPDGAVTFANSMLGFQLMGDNLCLLTIMSCVIAGDSSEAVVEIPHLQASTVSCSLAEQVYR